MSCLCYLVLVCSLTVLGSVGVHYINKPLLELCPNFTSSADRVLVLLAEDWSQDCVYFERRRMKYVYYLLKH